MNAEGRGSMPSSLQGMTAETISDALEDANLFTEIMTFIKKRCVNYGVDSGTVYSSQDPVVLRKVKQETLVQFSVLKQFEDGWPVTACLMKLFEVAPVVHKEDNNDHRDSGTTAVSPKRQRTNHAMVVLAPRNVGPGTGSAFRNNIAGASNHTGSKTCLSFCIPSSFNGSASTSATAMDTPSGPPAPSTVKTLLSSCVTPRDVERLVQLFASFGINHVDYLYILARMDSRDAWLREMRAKGDLTEIQMRALRDMLRRLAIW